MIYASSEKEFNKLWREFFIHYVSYEHCVKYLTFIYIKNFRERFVTCFINKILHFEIIITFRDESDHVLLKRRFETSIEDLKTMINDVNLLLMNEYHNYLLKLKEQKVRYSLDLHQQVYQQLRSYITHHALRKISHQYNLLTKRSTIIEACTNVFIIIIELSCSHKIQKRLYQDEFIHLKDVHSHWR